MDLLGVEHYPVPMMARILGMSACPTDLRCLPLGHVVSVGEAVMGHRDYNRAHMAPLSVQGQHRWYSVRIDASKATIFSCIRLYTVL